MRGVHNCLCLTKNKSYSCPQSIIVFPTKKPQPITKYIETTTFFILFLTNPPPYFNDESMYKWGSFQLSKYQQNIDRGWRVEWGVGVKNCLRIFVIDCRLKVDSNMGSRNYGLWEFMHYHPCNYFFVINVKFLLDKYLFKLTPEKSPYTLFQCFYCQSC